MRAATLLLVLAAAGLLVALAAVPAPAHGAGLPGKSTFHNLKRRLAQKKLFGHSKAAGATLHQTVHKNILFGGQETVTFSSPDFTGAAPRVPQIDVDGAKIALAGTMTLPIACKRVSVLAAGIPGAHTPVSLHPSIVIKNKPMCTITDMSGPTGPLIPPLKPTVLIKGKPVALTGAMTTTGASVTSAVGMVVAR